MFFNAVIRSIVTAGLLAAPVSISAQTSSATVAGLANNVVATTASGNARSEVTAPAATPAAEKKICRQLASSYSRMTKRTCLTEKEWKAVEDDAR